MTEQKHTPGPWLAEGEPHNMHIVLADRPFMRVCFLTSDGPTVANANLIAAAPDLLAALKACREMVGHPDNIALIDAAIRKAEGRE